jgi:hypothetical protein
MSNYIDFANFTGASMLRRDQFAAHCGRTAIGESKHAGGSFAAIR